MKKQRKAEWHVLLAEDNDDHALLVEMALERAADAPMSIHRARNGDEALELLGRVTPDLILLDLKMPGRSGHEVLEAVKGDDTWRRIPVAVLTSSDRDEDVARSYGLGGNHFITKPEDPVELEARLRTLLRNVKDMAAVRRGRGNLDPTAVSAMDPGSMALRKVGTWMGVVLALGFLVVLAWALGVIG